MKRYARKKPKETLSPLMQKALQVGEGYVICSIAILNYYIPYFTIHIHITSFQIHFFSCIRYTRVRTDKQLEMLVNILERRPTDMNLFVKYHEYMAEVINREGPCVRTAKEWLSVFILK